MQVCQCPPDPGPGPKAQADHVLGCLAMRRSCKFRRRPTKKQDAALSSCLEDTRQFYNAAPEVRREAWRIGRHRAGAG